MLLLLNSLIIVVGVVTVPQEQTAESNPNVEKRDPLQIVEEYFVTRHFNGVGSEKARKARKDIAELSGTFDRLHFPYFQDRLEVLVAARKELLTNEKLLIQRPLLENAIRIKIVTTFLAGESPSLWVEIANDRDWRTERVKGLNENK